MQTFSSEDLQSRPADVQQSAMMEPTFITVQGRPRLVMMSLDEFDRLRGRRYKVLDAASLSGDAMQDLQRIADQDGSGDTGPELLGGLLDDTAKPGLPPS